MNNQRYILLTFFTGAVLLGMSVRGLAVPLLASLEVADPLVLGTLNATTLVGIVVGIVSFLVFNRNQSAVQFTDESIGELRKVAWPDKDDTIRSTSIVVVVTLGIAAALASYDFVWGRITRAFLFTEG